MTHLGIKKEIQGASDGKTTANPVEVVCDTEYGDSDRRWWRAGGEGERVRRAAR